MDLDLYEMAVCDTPVAVFSVGTVPRELFFPQAMAWIKDVDPGFEEEFDKYDISYRWVVEVDQNIMDGEVFLFVKEHTEGAYPITLLWFNLDYEPVDMIVDYILAQVRNNLK